WFGEEVPKIMEAAELISEADIVIIIGTSMVVYPAAGLVNYAPENTPVFVVDPHSPPVNGVSNVEFITEPGSVGVPKLVDRLLADADQG
ncbi:MAG: Sir2 family NAD-dependent protein deacetylase, partial [Bacteroidota bacterium]